MKRSVLILWFLTTFLQAQTQISGSAVQIGGTGASPSATVQFSQTTTPPIAGQQIIISPTLTSANTCATANNVSAQGTFTAGGSYCEPSITWTFTTPTNIPVANITSIYPFIQASWTNNPDAYGSPIVHLYL